MNRYITCIVKSGSKSVKVYEAESEWMALKKICEDNTEEHRVKYIRNLDGERIEKRDCNIVYPW